MEVKREMILGAATLLAVVLIGAVSYFTFRSDAARRRHLTSEVPAEILEVYAARNRNNEEGKPGAVTSVRVSFRFVLNGETIMRSNTMSRDQGKEFEVGKPAKVCFNPEDHRQAELFPQSYQCGG